MKKLLVATSNQGKLREIQAILGDSYEIINLKSMNISDDDVIENGKTFAENAYIKAHAAYEKSGMNTLADDSGLTVAALMGAPGVRSARYSGKGDAENNALLLKNLDGITDRAAKFVCAMCMIKDGEAIYAYGETDGYILDAPDGNGGFGYDPLFFSNDLGKSFGAASEQEKNSVSHRKKALENLKKLLRS